MLINPFLTVENQNGVYYFSEKYGKTKKPFLTLQSKRELAELINDRELNQKIIKHLNYSFAIPEHQKELFSLLEENVALCSELVNKTMLAKFLMYRLHSATIEFYNYSHLNLQHLKKMLELENGTESRVQVVIYDKNSHIQDFQPTCNQGLLLFFEVCGEKLRGVGPFVEVSADGTKMSYFQEEKNIERKVEKEESYWNRSIEEVVLDTVLSAITDYFSDYITVSSPFMYRRAILNEDTVCLCEAFTRQ